MRRDPKKESQRWLIQAEQELKDAISIVELGSYYLTLFLCHQSAEKALKAFVYLHEEEPIMTHSVSSLLKIAESIDSEFANVKESKRLDDYYIPTRYPNGVPDEAPAEYYDDVEEAKQAIQMAEGVVKLVRQKIQA